MFSNLVNVETKRGTFIIYNHIEKRFKFLYDNSEDNDIWETTQVYSTHDEIQQQLGYYGFTLEDIEEDIVFKVGGTSIYWLPA